MHEPDVEAGGHFYPRTALASVCLVCRQPALIYSTYDLDAHRQTRAPFCGVHRCIHIAGDRRCLLQRGHTYHPGAPTCLWPSEGLPAGLLPAPKPQLRRNCTIPGCFREVHLVTDVCTVHRCPAIDQGTRRQCIERKGHDTPHHHPAVGMAGGVWHMPPAQHTTEPAMCAAPGCSAMPVPWSTHDRKSFDPSTNHTVLHVDYCPAHRCTNQFNGIRCTWRAGHSGMQHRHGPNGLVWSTSTPNALIQQQLAAAMPEPELPPGTKAHCYDDAIITERVETNDEQVEGRVHRKHLDEIGSARVAILKSFTQLQICLRQYERSMDEVRNGLPRSSTPADHYRERFQDGLKLVAEEFKTFVRLMRRR